ncbi:MAG TPA: lysophospholipid acyltransferase family protein [Nitriliruptorales bacterium]
MSAAPPSSTADWATRRVTARTRHVRRVWWRVVHGSAVSLWCRPLQVHGLTPSIQRRLRHGPPLLVAANHASHADTAVLSLLLGRPARGRLVPAAAEDHFFSPRWLGWVVAVLVGALPFPRSGTVGLARCRQALADGEHVLLFPQGTRGGGRFQRGIGLLASEGIEVLPVHLAGTGGVLPKGSRWPRRAAVTVRIGPPLDLRGSGAALATTAIERAVLDLVPSATPHARSAA